jgi:hypothetical protein
MIYPSISLLVDPGEQIWWRIRLFQLEWERFLLAFLRWVRLLGLFLGLFPSIRIFSLEGGIVPLDD